MNKKLLSLALTTILSLFSTISNAIVFCNDVYLLAEADPRYEGFAQARVYVNGIEVPQNQTIDAGTKSCGYVIEIDIPANFAYKLKGSTLTTFWDAMASMVRAVLRYRFIPDYEDSEYSIADVLVRISMGLENHTLKTTNTVRGIRSITVNIHQ